MGKEPLPVFVFGCLSCGKTVAGNEGACPRCGASFDDVRFECPFCGALISPQQHRCNECGTEFGQFAEDVSETSTIDLDGAGGVVEDHSGDLREIGRNPPKRSPTSVRIAGNQSRRRIRSAHIAARGSARIDAISLGRGRDRELNPGQGIHSPQGYHYPTPATFRPHILSVDKVYPPESRRVFAPSRCREKALSRHSPANAEVERERSLVRKGESIEFRTKSRVTGSSALRVMS